MAHQAAQQPILPHQPTFRVNTGVLLRTQSDERLIAKVRAGNDRAFDVLYQRHGSKVLSYARHLLGNQYDAEDAVQHAFVNAYNYLVGSSKPIAFQPWLFRIVHNCCMSFLRAHQDQASELDPIDSRGLSGEVERREELKAVLRDLAALPTQQRAALILAELAATSQQEIAEILDCEPGKVKSLIYMARTALIDSRNAREADCEKIREQLSVLDGRSMRRREIKLHLRQCAGCKQFHEQVKLQRVTLSSVLPVTPMFVLAGYGGISSSGLFGAACASGASSAGGIAAGTAGTKTISAALAGVAGKLGVTAGAAKIAVTAATAAVVVAGGAVNADKIGLTGHEAEPQATAVSGPVAKDGAHSTQLLPLNKLDDQWHDGIGMMHAGTGKRIDRERDRSPRLFEPKRSAASKESKGVNQKSVHSGSGTRSNGTSGDSRGGRNKSTRDEHSRGESKSSSRGEAGKRSGDDGKVKPTKVKPTSRSERGGNKQSKQQPANRDPVPIS